MNFLCSYESIIATLCESLDTLDEPEAKVHVFLLQAFHSCFIV
jgi:hypothetical protein